MFLRIAGVRSTEQSGIRGGKIPFDPNIFVTHDFTEAQFLAERIGIMANGIS